MSNPTEQLRRLLDRPPPSAGEVIRVESDGTILVATKNGQQTLQRAVGDASIYRSGDRVRISGGLVIGRPVAASSGVYLV